MNSEPIPTVDEFAALARRMRANSERWFPHLHRNDARLPLSAFYAMGLGGEAGEVLNEVKKLYRDGATTERRDKVAAELGDVFTYLVLLADELCVDLMAEYEAQCTRNAERWG